MLSDAERSRREDVALAYAGLVEAIAALGMLTVDMAELDAFAALLRSALDAVEENRAMVARQAN